MVWTRSDRPARMFVQVPGVGTCRGPLHAGAFGPDKLDSTFGPKEVFVAAPPAANTSPLEGYQFFGEVGIDAQSRNLRVDLRDIRGRSLWSKTLSGRFSGR